MQNKTQGPHRTDPDTDAHGDSQAGATHAGATPAASPNGRLGRRLLVLRMAGIGAAAALPTATVQAAELPAIPVRTDSDPGDSAGYGRGGSGGRTDNDPRDAAGNGRGAYYNAPQRRSSTDNDPRDAAGNGRSSSAPQRRSVTDSDPNDGQGQGRGWR